MNRPLLALVLGLLVCVLAEGGARAVLGPPPSAVKVYAIVPPGARYFTEEEGNVRIGYQMPLIEITFPAAAPRKRIAIIGGSSVHAGLTPNGANGEFPALLEKTTGVDTLNLGSASLDTHDHRRQVDELSAWDFAGIILYAGHNDFGNSWFLQRYGGMSGKASAFTRATLEHSRIYWLLRSQLSPVVYTPAATFRAGSVHRSPIDTEATVRDLVANVRWMAWKCRSVGIPFVVVVPASNTLDHPVEQHCTGEGPCAQTLWEQALQETDRKRATEGLYAAMDADEAPLRAPRVAMEALRAIEGVTVIDADRDLPRDRIADVPSRDLFLDYVHFNQAGHAAMARLLAPVVAELGK